VTTLTVLDVGHGNAAVLRGPDAVIAIDAGPGRNAMLEYLLQQKIPRLDAVVISHADEDHLRGLIAVLESDSVSVAKVYLNSNAVKRSQVWDDLLWSLDGKHDEGALDFQVALNAGDTLPRVAEGIDLEVVTPHRYLGGHGVGWTDKQGRRATTNTLSIVLRLVVDGEPQVLLASDIDEMGLAYAADRQADLTAPHLIFPHHGGNVGEKATADDNEAFARRLVAQVRPHTVVFSTGRGSHATPRPEIMRATRSSTEAEPRILCTQLSKHCRPNAEPPQSAFGHLLPVYSAGAHTQRCCAGTLRFTVRNGPLIPSSDAHETFKTEHSPSALCRVAHR
jgi:beta-lactamase superfamily II metal-dependent hydrolase